MARHAETMEQTKSVSDPNSPSYDVHSPYYDVTADSSSSFYVGPPVPETKSGDEIRNEVTQQVNQEDASHSDWLSKILDPIFKDAKIQNRYEQKIEESKQGLADGLAIRATDAPPTTVWANATHEQMNAAISQNAEPATVAASSEEWVAVGNELAEHQENLANAISSSTSNWQGSGGDAAREHLANVGKWLGSTAKGATLTGHQQQIHSQALNETQKQMNANPPVAFSVQDANARLQTITDPIQYATAASQEMAVYKEQQAAREQAAQVMTQFDGTVANAVTTPAFAPPPKLPSQAGASGANGGGAGSQGLTTPRQQGTPAGANGAGGAGAGGAGANGLGPNGLPLSASGPNGAGALGPDGLPIGGGSGAGGGALGPDGLPIGGGSGAGGSGLGGSGAGGAGMPPLDIPGGGAGGGSLGGAGFGGGAGGGFSPGGIAASSGGSGSGLGGGAGGGAGGGMPSIPNLDTPPGLEGGSFSGSGLPGGLGSVPGIDGSTTASGFNPTSTGGGAGGGSGFSPSGLNIPSIPDSTTTRGGSPFTAGGPGGASPFTSGGTPDGFTPGGIPTIGQGGGVNGNIGSRLGGLGPIEPGSGIKGGSLGGIGGGGAGGAGSGLGGLGGGKGIGGIGGGGVGGGSSLSGGGSGLSGGSATGGALAAEEAAAARAAAAGGGARGAAGASGMGGMGAGAGKGKGDDDKEYRLADYLEADDPSIFAPDEAVAPPVIGDWKNTDWK